MQQQRSTKGASKQRRDCINVEINQIKEVLPVSDSVRRRLSQLQVMALCNSYIHKSNCFLNALSVNDEQSFDEASFFDFSEALPGFLLAITSDGRLLYISENVTEYLGHSMVELMTQAETIYEMIEAGDERRLREFLMRARIQHDTVRETSRDELAFTCRVNLGRLFRRNNVFDRQKMIKIQGRFIWPEGELHLAEPIFVARCSPLLSAFSTEQPSYMDTSIFHSSHSLDMKYTNIEENGEFYLGYSENELLGGSWYQFIHPEDTQEACRKHAELLNGGLDTPRSLVVRMQTRSGAYIWIHIVMYLGNTMIGPLGLECSQQEIFCLNHVMDERDALETKRRENLDLLVAQGQRNGMFESAAVAPACIPTVVVDERFMEPVATQGKAAIPRDRQELMERIKVIAMEKKSKRPRMEIDGEMEAYMKVDAGRQGANMMTSLGGFGEFNGGLTVDQYSLHGPLTPPFSDDGRVAPSPASLHSPRSASMAYTPPYSPPSSLDDASLFDAVQQQKARKPFVKPQRSLMTTGLLPELGENFVVDYFQDVEYGSDTKPNLSNNGLASAMLQEMSKKQELQQLNNDGRLLQMMYANGAESFANLLAAAPYFEESFLDLIESPLALQTIDPTSLQFP